MGTAACTSREFWVTFLSKGSLEEVLNDTGWQTSDSGILYLIEGWANSFYWKKAWRKNLGGEVGFLKCLCFVIYTCHIFLCIYQVLHNKIKRLKIKRKRRHNRKPKSFSTGHSQMVFWSALPGLLSGAASEGWGSTAQSWFLWSNTAGDLSQLSEFQSGEGSSAPSSIAFSSSLSMNFCLISTAASYSVGNHRPWVYCWSNNLSNPMKCLEQSFLSIAPSYSKGLHFPLPYPIIYPGKTPTPFPTQASGRWGGNLSLNVITKPHLFCFLPPPSFLNFTIPFQNDLQLLSPRTGFHLRSSHLSVLNPTVVC